MSQQPGSFDIEAVRAIPFGTTTVDLTEQQVILYNLSLGCSAQDLKYTFEGDKHFSVLPTFGVIPGQAGLALVDLGKLLPNFNPAHLLHGEHYLELLSPACFPTSGKLITRPEIIDMQDKGKAAVVVVGTHTFDESSNQLIAYNEFTTFVVGSGGFGRTPPASRPAAATAANKPPQRAPDAIVREQVHPDQAALYRLNGDYNPLHIDPTFSAQLGFPKPILHGLCTFGLSAKHVIQKFGYGDPCSMKSIKVRFSKHVFPGETIETRMWHIAGEQKVMFETWVVDRNEAVITAAAVQFKGSRQTNASGKIPSSRL